MCASSADGQSVWHQCKAEFAGTLSTRNQKQSTVTAEATEWHTMESDCAVILLPLNSGDHHSAPMTQ